MIKKKDIPKEYRNGNCYESAFNLLHNNKSATLIHGLIIGQDKLEGVKYIHAWIEYNGLAFDFSNNNQICLPIKKYRELTRVQHLVKYTFKEAIKHILETEHYGYWDKQLGSMETIKW